jgi:hypothetical protein
MGIDPMNNISNNNKNTLCSKLDEAVIQHTPLNIISNSQQMHIFPYQFQERERSNPSSPSKLPSNSKKASLQEVCTTLAHPFIKRCTKNHLQER